MQPVEVAVRDARAADAEAIDEISRRAWAEAYRELLPADFLQHRAGAPAAGEWRAYVRSLPGGHRLLVAEVEGGVVGFVRFGPADELAGDEPDAGEIYGFYVAPERIGEGIGRLLLGAALDRLRADGFRTAMLWTFAGNRRAERFYARAGFALDGATRPERESGAEERRWRTRL